MNKRTPVTVWTAQAFIVGLSIMLGCAAFPAGVAAHTFHTSLMEMDYNAETQSVEIAVQVFSHDLESVLTKRNGKSVRLDKTPNVAELTLAYLQSACTLKNREGQEKTFNWVGMEAKADAVWLYVETKMPEGLDGAEMRDRIFFEQLEDQVNLVHVKYNGKKADLVFKIGDEFKAIVEAK
jgi:hypothetical protein